MRRPSPSVIIESMHEIASDVDNGCAEIGHAIALQWAVFAMMDNRSTAYAREIMLDVAHNIDQQQPQPDDGASLRYAANLLLETTR